MLAEVEIDRRRDDPDRVRSRKQFDLLVGDRVEMVYRNGSHIDRKPAAAEIGELVDVSLKLKTEAFCGLEYLL